MGIAKDAIQGLITGLLDSFLAPIKEWLGKRSAVKAALTSQKLAQDENRLEAIHEDQKIDADVAAHPNDDSMLFAPKDRAGR